MAAASAAATMSCRQVVALADLGDPVERDELDGGLAHAASPELEPAGEVGRGVEVEREAGPIDDHRGTRRADRLDVGREAADRRRRRA